jgi:hypothetical protein
VTSAAPLALIALIYACQTILFCWLRNWPWALMSFGCCLVLIGNIWAIAKNV